MALSVQWYLQAQREIADLKGVLEDLAAKVEELEGAVRENESTRNALKAAFSRLAAVQVSSTVRSDLTS